MRHPPKWLAAAVIAAIAALSIAWWLHDSGTATPPPATGASSGRGEPPAVATTDLPRPPAGEHAAAEREALPATGTAAAAAPTGRLLVHVRYPAEPAAGAGLTVTVRRPHGDLRLGLVRASTDAAGDVVFDALAPGDVIVAANRSDKRVRAVVRAGETVECTLPLSDSGTVNGVVVDQDGVGIGGAIVESAPAATVEQDAEVVAVTAADGSFELRSCSWHCLLGARAAGFAASPLHYVEAAKGTTVQVRIPLTTRGGSVQGVVVDAGGAPVPDAVVRVGEGQTDAVRSTAQGAPPLPAQVRTDADGRFTAIGVPPGTQPLWVRALGFAPWSGTCEVAAGGTAAVRIALGAGVTCEGLVRNEAGAPLPDVPVRCGTYGDFLQYSVRSGPDGAFTLRDLPAGDVELTAETRELGKAKTRVRGEPGATVQCELVLSFGLALRGTVLDQDGVPVSPAWLDCVAEGAGAPWFQRVHIAKTGAFVVPECPAGRRLLVSVGADEHVPQELRGIDPAAGELHITLPRDTRAKAAITGRILGPDGRAAAGAEVTVIRQRIANITRDVTIRDGDGAFRIEVVPGPWEVRVRDKRYAAVFAGARELDPGAAWDLGTIALTNGGTLVVHDGAPKGVEYLVLTAAEQFRCGLYSPAPPLRSEALVAGDYLLLVAGKGIAARVLPFTIADGEQTELLVKAEPGVRQAFLFVPAAGAPLPRSVSCTLRHRGKRLAYLRTSRDAAGELSGEKWLAPGDYEVVPEGAPRGTPFSVRAAEGPAVRVTLP